MHTHSTQERKSSFAYDYAQDEESGFRALSVPPEGYYEFDSASAEEPFWKPACVEDELKAQLQDGTCTLSDENLT